MSLYFSQKGKKSSIDPQKLISLAQNSVAPQNVFPVEPLIYHINLFFLQNQLSQLEQKLISQTKSLLKNSLKILTSIKGISEKTASLFLAEIQNIQKFSNAKKLIKYAGTDPVIKQSGKFEKRKKISKNGSPYLRYVLYQMAQGVSRWNVSFRLYYLKKIKEFGSHKKTMVAVINKLLRVIYALLTKNEKFDESKCMPQFHISNCQIASHLEVSHA